MKSKNSPSLPRNNHNTNLQQGVSTNSVRNIFFPKSVNKLSKVTESGVSTFKVKNDIPTQISNKSNVKALFKQKHAIELDSGLLSLASKGHIIKKIPATPVSKGANCSLGSLTPIVKNDGNTSSFTRPSAGNPDFMSILAGRSPSDAKPKLTNSDSISKNEAICHKFFLKGSFNHKPGKRTINSTLNFSKAPLHKKSFRVTDFGGQLCGNIFDQPVKYSAIKERPTHSRRIKDRSSEMSAMKSAFQRNQNESQTHASIVSPESRSKIKSFIQFQLTERDLKVIEQLYANEALLFDILTTICESRDIYLPFKQYWNQTSNFDFEYLLVNLLD